MRSRVMIVGRDVTLRARLARLLNGAGYRVEIADSARHAGRLGFKGIALAIVAPEGLGQEGKSLLQELQAAVGSVLLVATPGGERELRSDVLDVSDEAGVLARVAQVLEPAQSAGPDVVEPVLQFAGYRLNLSGHSLLDPTGKGVPLTRGEFSLLRVFVRRPGRVLSRDQLLQMLAGHDAEAYDRSIDMQIVRLRRKIEPDPRRPSLIVTIPGSGYRFSATVTAAATDVPAEPHSEAAAAMPPPPAMSERRQLTIMQCALCGSAFTSAQGDPEDFHRLLTLFHESGARIVAQSGGAVARLLNDGLLAYFGYPQADEHQAERAIRAALQLVQASGPVGMGGPDGLWTRVSIATGLVVVGGLLGASGEPAALGEPAILATGLLAHAESGVVLISATTRRLVGELFQCEVREPIALAGFSEPVTVWQVIGQRAAEDRFEALRGPHAADVVGRDEELALLLRRWEEAKSGDGCVVLISGEPGIGKSRIVKAMRDRIDAEAHTHARYFCSPHHRDSALHPIIAQLQRTIGFRREDTAEQRLIKLETALDQTTNKVGEAAPLLAELLSIPTGDRYPPLNLTPQKRKERTLASLLAQIEEFAARGPALLIFEDVHWVDPTTREALDLIVDRAPRLSILLIITFRPEFAPPWIGRSHVTLLAINRLRPRERSQMITRVTGGKALPTEIVDHILDRSDGVPLFIEELTKAILESGTLAEGDDRYTIADAAGLPAIPTTLHASLLVRLDLSAPTRLVAQIGAAIGRHFSHELISAVAQMPPQEVDDALATLASSELIFSRGTPPDAEYTFKHALVQDAAYDTLPKSQRKDIHGRIARVLEAQFSEVVEQQPALLAQHFTQAGLTEKALHWRLRAGWRAISLSADADAIVQITRGFSLLDSVVDEKSRSAWDLRLNLALITPIISLHGYTSQQLEQVLDRVLALSKTTPVSRDIFPVLYGRISFEVVTGFLDKAMIHAWEALKLARTLSDGEGTSVQRHTLGSLLLYSGRPYSATRILKGALPELEDDRHLSSAFVYGQDHFVLTASYLCLAMWSLGRINEAHLYQEQAFQRAERVNHLNTFCVAQAFAGGIFGALCREPENTKIAATKLLRLASEHQLPVWLPTGTILLGQALIETGQVQEGIDKIREGVASLKTIHIWLFQPLFVSWIAAACAECGDVDGGQAALAEGWAISRRGEHWMDAELNRLAGELLLARSASLHDEAERYFSRALEISRKQLACSQELRATMSLARLLKGQGHIERADALLKRVCGRVTSQWETKDLKAAKELIVYPSDPTFSGLDAQIAIRSTSSTMI